MKISFLTLFLICISTIYVSSQSIKINEAQSANVSTLIDNYNETPDWFELINTGNNSVNIEGYGIGNNPDPDSAWIFPYFNLEPEQIILVYASGRNKSRSFTYWHTLITQGDTMKYILPENNINNWYINNFDDSEWSKGASGFGYSDSDDNTIIKNTVSLYLRKTFIIENVSDISEASLHMDYDDGFIAYLNGVEICRSATMGSSDVFQGFNATALSGHEAVMYNGGIPEKFLIPDFSDILIEGENVLAIQVHNVSENSSDMTAIPYFSVRRSEKPDKYLPAFFLFENDDFHTNFKLNKDSAGLFLFLPDDSQSDALVFSSPGDDFSVGFAENNYTQFMAFKDPTPGMPNTSEALEFRDSLNIEFDTQTGIHEGSVALKINKKDSVEKIYYTTDGTVPTEDSKLYHEDIIINIPTTIKARGFKEGHIPGEIITGSFFPRYSKNLPVVFISTDPDNLWDVETGIYVLGNDYENTNPYFGANFWEDWEKPAHVEMYFPNGENNLKFNAGIKIYGAWSRAHAQKSLSVFARKKYGDKSVKAKLFEDKSLDKFEAFIFRNSGNDWYGGQWSSGTYYRDLLITQMASKMGVDVQSGRPVIIYLNGQYWGIQNMREKINEHFVADNHKEDSDKIDLLETSNNIVDGSNQHYLSMLSFVNSNDMLNDENIDKVSKLIDIDEFINYNISEIYSFNGDWPGNNIKFWRPQRSGGKWRWILYDTDFGFGLYDNNNVYNNTLRFATRDDGPGWPNPPWSTFLLRTLLKNKSFRNKFVNNFADHLNTVFLPENVNALIDERISSIDQEIQDHVVKWNGSYEGWQSNNNNVRNFANLRPNIMWSHINNFFNLNGMNELNIFVTGTNNASIQLNSINIKEFPWRGTYFYSVPVELTAIAPEGYRFVRWEGGSTSTDPKIKVSVNTNRLLTAVFEEWQPTESEGIVINEISYRASREEDGEDWVELYNNSAQYINLSGWILQDSDETHRYIIPENTILDPYEYLVISRDLYDFNDIYPDVTDVIGPFGFGFSGTGECISLFNSAVALKDQVCYSINYPWPEEANGGGYTLSLSDPDLDNMEGINWNNSPVLNGTPGIRNDNLTYAEDKMPDVLSCALLDCYPNPFRSKLHIPVVIDKSQNVKIDVYNIEGQLISNVYDGILNNGIHNLEWNDNTGISGLLIVKLQTSMGVQVKKVMKIY